MTFNTAAKIGAGACITGMAIQYLKDFHPVTIVGLTVMGQALAWMPDFVSRCLRVVRGSERPTPSLSTMPKDILVEIQKNLNRRDIEALALVDKAQYRDRAKNSYAAARRRFVDKVEEGKPIPLQEIRELIAFNPALIHIYSKPFKLDLSNSDINDAELQYIITRFPNITEINARSCGRLTATGLQSLAGLTKLTMLDLSCCFQITDTDLQSLKDLTNLTSLYLNITLITNAGLQNLAGLTNLSELGLAGCFHITDLQSLEDLTNLTKLYLDDCSITDAKLPSLAGLTNLTRLSLSSPRITDVRSLASLTNLTQLDLSGCRITDAGLQPLAGLTNLTSLDLEGNSITDDGLQHLVNLTKLTELNLMQCFQITPAGRAFLAHLANLTITG